MPTRLSLSGHRDSLRPALERARPAAPRRRAAARKATPIEVGPDAAAEVGIAESAAFALRGILHAATDLLGAKQGFLLTCNDGGRMEVTCVRDMRPVEVMDLVLTQAALTVRTVLREGVPLAADELGRAFMLEANVADSRRAALYFMPLDLGERRSGLFCAVRGTEASMIGGLDLEILQGLCDQAALMIGASSACTALAHLEACLKAGSLAPPRVLS